MYHKSKNSQHGGTSIVELDSTLGKLGLLIEGIPSEVKRSITEVTGEVTRLGTVGRVLHDSKLKSSNEGDNLEKSSLGEGSYSGPTIRDGVEGSSGSVNVSWKVNSGTGDDVSEESKLGDTSVLDLNITESVETLLIGIIKKSKRIEKSILDISKGCPINGSGPALGTLRACV